ncbi:helix-turn-helix transcriptional regulator [Streptomyces sp. NPDC002055]|uniref:helix-turn-helix domain-containing protein n=1 Tax=Streptomyces sp. NPDC002055 TaxID=3154534 RepID=UPI0033291DDD
MLQQRCAVRRRVRRHREEAWLSQEQLAHLAGVGWQAVYRTELGAHRISVDHLVMIARAHDVSVVDLFTA